MEKIIYLDNAATTRTAPEVVDAMLPYFTEKYGNPSSVYGFAAENKEVISRQRRVIAEVLGAKENEIYFTAGWTAAGHRGLTLAAKEGSLKAKHINNSRTTHYKNLHPSAIFEKNGY